MQSVHYKGSADTKVVRVADATAVELTIGSNLEFDRGNDYLVSVEDDVAAWLVAQADFELADGSSIADILTKFELAHPALNSQAGDYVLVLADDGKIVYCTKGTAGTVTIPANASVAFPVGTTINVLQAGAGAMTITAAGGVTLDIDSTYTAVTAGQWSSVELNKVAVNTWVAHGDLVPA